MILDRIIAAKKKELEHRKISLPIGSIMEAVKEAPKPRDFMAALEKKSPAVIAEIKRSSPSKGRIAEDFDPLAIARNYERGGASALSVLTEEKFFEGSIEYLARIRRITGLPLLRKDFIIDPYQIYETRVFGGDALLLIARILDAHTLARFIALAELLHMAPLVEVHTMKELKKALFAGATIIGINNRDLDTFVTDITVSASLAPFIPPWICIVSESGIWSRNEIDVLSEKGIHAFLIGESLMRSNDVVAALEGLTGKKK